MPAWPPLSSAGRLCRDPSPVTAVPFAVGLLTALAAWLVMTPPERARQHPLQGLVRLWRSRAPDQRSATAGVSELADVADLLALVLSAGCGVIEAVELVGDHYPGVLGQHLRTVGVAARWGLDERAQWSAVPQAWAPICGALQIASEAGVPPAELLAGVAQDLRREEAHRIDVASAKLGAKAVLPLGLAFLPAFVLTTVVPVVLVLAGDLIG